jgi:hypothetical protein
VSLFTFGRRRFLSLLGVIGLVPLKQRWLRSLGAFLGGIDRDVSTRADDAGSQNPSAVSALPENGPRVFRSPGAEYQNTVQNFVIEFLNHFQAKQGYPISRIFQIFPFQVTDRGKAQDLISRGNVEFSGESAQNSGEKIEVKFTDQNVGKLSVVFKSEMRGKLSNISKRSFTLTFDPSHQVPVVFYELDPKHEMGPNQVLESIDFTPKLVSYTLHEVGEESRKIRIEIDLTRSGVKKAPETKSPRGSLSHSDQLSPALVPVSLTAYSGQAPSSTSQDEACQDTRFQVGGIRSDCCGGHTSNGQPCPGTPGQPQQLDPHPVTYVNKSGITLYIYYAIYAGGTFDCLNLGYDGTLSDGQQKTYVIPIRKVGWFKFQENTDGAGCPISNNKFESHAFGGSSVEETVYIW